MSDPWKEFKDLLEEKILKVVRETIQQTMNEMPPPPPLLVVVSAEKDEPKDELVTSENSNLSLNKEVVEGESVQENEMPPHPPDGTLLEIPAPKDELDDEFVENIVDPENNESLNEKAQGDTITISQEDKEDAVPNERKSANLKRGPSQDSLDSSISKKVLRAEDSGPGPISVRSSTSGQSNTLYDLEIFGHYFEWETRCAFRFVENRVTFRPVEPHQEASVLQVQSDVGEDERTTIKIVMTDILQLTIVPRVGTTFKDFKISASDTGLLEIEFPLLPKVDIAS